MSDIVEVNEKKYRRVLVFWSDWCCRLHPLYVRSIVGYELEAL